MNNITKDELKVLLEKLDNGVDKFIVAGLYYGLNNSDHRDQLLNLKVDMVDLTNNTIYLPDGRVVVMDKILRDSTIEAINQKVYIKMGGKHNEADRDYEFNFKSEYIIKTKPTKITNFGLAPLKNAGFKKRIRSISEFLTGDASIITPSSLKKDGAFEALKGMREKLTIAEAEIRLRKIGLSIKRNNLLPMVREINSLL